jgi:hypothetical protein
VEGAEPSRRSPLMEVKALERPVTFSETKIPLGELVQKVAAETGVELVAVREVADEPVVVVVNGLPARVLLVQLAQLLDYQWSRRGKEGAWRYEIWQDLASKQREEALRRAAIRRSRETAAGEDRTRRGDGGAVDGRGPAASGGAGESGSGTGEAARGAARGTAP